ncbi:TonB-dependent receptor domain-containing protein [Massilia consociata]|uniref:TonB-dependent receptor domain-containing protein n=1 Tax=Massilia consociata TaxID=760117 RepID=A0ABV6FCC8_9BURK
MLNKAPRYLYRPANLGKARIQGVNLEARLSGKDAWASLPELELYGSLGLARSELDDIPGPDNRVEGQSPLRAKFGGGYQFRSLPLKLRFDLSYLPGDWWRESASQRVFESSKLTVGGNASWDADKDTRVVVSLDNLLSRKRHRTDEYLQSEGMVRRLSSSDDHARISIRLEKKL